MNVLELKDVSITYQNTKEAVKHVGFAVPEGRIVAIVGESGSGKSTLIRAEKGWR
ncbi:MAG: ATP-binding cassette domain-containing protein [Coprococcus sp.]|jgi:ABC-type glutathione transport system ATPase component